MSYSDPNYTVRVFVPVNLGVSFGTSTGTTITTTAIAALPKYFQRTQVHKVRMRCSVIPNAASTALVASFLNGTNTFATVTLTTATAGQWVDGTVTDANAVIADDTAPTITLTGTATASAAANGTWDIWFEQRQAWDATAV